MPKFRKKPVVIEAEKARDIIDRLYPESSWVCENVDSGAISLGVDENSLDIQTLEGVMLGDLMIAANALATREAPGDALDKVIAEARRIAIRDVEAMFSDTAVDAYDAMAMKHSDQLNSAAHMVAEMLDGEDALAKQEAASDGD